MTAKERALEVVCDLDPDWLDDPVAKVAAAIRAAEDEALERVARHFDALRSTATPIDSQPAKWAAKVTRSLKSGGAK